MVALLIKISPFRADNKTKATFVIHSNPVDPILMEAKTPDGDKVFLVGTKDSRGAPRKVDFFHIIDQSGNVTDVYLGDNGRPVDATDDSGARITFSWGDNYTSVHLDVVNSDRTSQVNINIDLVENMNGTLRQKREINKLVDLEVQHKPETFPLKQRRQANSNIAIVTINVTSCGIPEVGARVGAEIGYKKQSLMYTSVLETFGEVTDTEGIFKVTLPIELASESADTCNSVEETIEEICAWYLGDSGQESITFLICHMLNGVLPGSMQRADGNLFKLCLNSFIGFEVYCGDRTDRTDTDQTRSVTVCDRVTGVSDSALEVHEGSSILFKPYAVFENGQKVHANGKMLELVPGTIGSFVIENTSPAVKNLVVEPVDPDPLEDYVVNVTYTCTTANVNVTMEIVGTDGYNNTVICNGGTTCTLYVPGAEALVEDTVTVGIRDDPNFNFWRTILLIF